MNLPTINVGMQGQGKEKFYFATQLDVIADQIYRGNLIPGMTSEMINFAQKSSAQNYIATLNEGKKTLNQNLSAGTAFGISIEPGMIRIPAYLLPSPETQYGNGRPFRPRQGRGFWKPGEGTAPKDLTFVNIKEKLSSNADHLPVIKFYHSGDLKHGKYLKSYIKNFMLQLEATGILTSQEYTRLPLPDAEATTNWTEDSLKAKFRNMNVDLAVLILPANNGANRKKYNAFKTVMDQKLGFKSICMCKSNMIYSNKEKKRDFNGDSINMEPTDLSDYMRNLAMKVNLRLGNFNHTLGVNEFPKLGDNICNTIILGADVTHPGSGGATGSPSIAAVVGSVDGKFARFLGSMKLNKARDDIIEDMTAMTVERLRDWAEQTGRRLADKILFYRDGVGESRFSELRQTEVRRINEAWAQLFREFYRYDAEESQYPRITVVVATKRHHTRFYLTGVIGAEPGPDPTTDNSKTADKIKCQAGTVVQPGCTSPYCFDFYLLSHNAIIGTPRPTHYFVLQDGIGFSAGELQQLTFNLCFLYGRSLKSVSYVPAAYFADRLCERGALFLKPFLEKSQKNQTEQEVRADAEKAFYISRPGKGNPWHPNHDKTMLWM